MNKKKLVVEEIERIKEKKINGRTRVIKRNNAFRYFRGSILRADYPPTDNLVTGHRIFRTNSCFQTKIVEGSIFLSDPRVSRVFARDFGEILITNFTIFFCNYGNYIIDRKLYLIIIYIFL